MKIITNRPIYVGRYIHSKEVRNSLSREHLLKYGFFNPIIHVGDTEPFVILPGTEVVDLGGNEFESWEDFVFAYENDMIFGYVLSTENNRKFWNLVECANVTNDCLGYYEPVIRPTKHIVGFTKKIR